MILVLNCGSQSIKWKIFDDRLRLVKENNKAVLDRNNFQSSLEDEFKGMSSFEIKTIAHRVVHGGSVFVKPLKITEGNLVELEKLSTLAPLHNPYNILGIKVSRSVFKSIPQFAVFDTEFFSNLPPAAYTYALPEDVVKKFGFRRYGFHGTSHEYVANEAAKIIKKPFSKLNIITCHLGGGASVAAIKKGRAVDTSMGFTPLEGLVMMTRSGDLDAGVVLELVKEFSLERTREILNKESGVKGVCGQSEMLKVLESVKAGDEKAKLALDIFVYSIQKYIGAYFAVMGGCDVLVFTGSIGSGSAKIRSMACKSLKILNKTKILAIQTDEELAIATKIVNIL